MSIYINPNASHSIVAANSHYYKQPTKERYIDRTLPCHDLIYLVEGGWSITENEQEYPLKKDDVLLLSAGRHHYTRLPCAPGTKTFCIHVSCAPGEEVSEQTEEYPSGACQTEKYREDVVRINAAHTETVRAGAAKKNAAQADVIKLPTLLSAHNHPKIRQYFSEITSAYWQEGAYKEKRLSALLELLFLELIAVTEAKSLEPLSLAERAIELLTAAPHIHYTCKAVADMLYVSTKTLDNAMYQKTGMSFHTYQKERKLEMAASLLLTEPDLHLREIANTLGFYDEFHLSKAFKQKYGMSPREYRK